jgi:hypothetical protein
MIRTEGEDMASQNSRAHERFVDKIAALAMPRTDSDVVTQRPARWWIFFMPGKVILWIEYMFPRRISTVFGSARRRNIPLLQILYSLYFYFAAIAVGLYLFIVAHGR